MVWCTRVQDCIYSPIINDNLAGPFVLSSDTEVSLNTNCKHVQRDERTIDFNCNGLKAKKEGARSRTISSIDLCKQFELKREDKLGDNIIDSIMLTTLSYRQTWTDAFLAEQESHGSIGEDETVSWAKIVLHFTINGFHLQQRRTIHSIRSIFVGHRQALPVSLSWARISRNPASDPCSYRRHHASTRRDLQMRESQHIPIRSEMKFADWFPRRKKRPIISSAYRLPVNTDRRIYVCIYLWFSLSLSRSVGSKLGQIFVEGRHQTGGEREGEKR